MTTRLTSRAAPKCLLVFGLPLLIVSAIAAAITLPWLSVAGRYDDEIIARRERLIKFLTVAAERPVLEQEIQRLKDNMRHSDFYFNADKPALGAANIQKRVKSVVDESGGKLISTQSLPFSTKDEVTEVKVRVRVSGDTDAVVKMMHALEADKPYLLIEKFTARSRPITQRSNNRANRRNSPPPPPRTTYDLNVNFDVVAYLRTEAT